jgi:hypothetical protein
MSEYTDPRVFSSSQEVAQGLAIAEQYQAGNVVGWGGENLAREAFKLLSSSFYSGFSDEMKRAAEGKKMFLYRAVRAALGQDTKNYPQQIGDCVSFGAKNATEYLSCCDIVIRGDREKFRPVFPPYFYGIGRVYVGQGRLGNEDGSLGSWMAEAVMKYGTLFADEANVPAYSGSVAKQWGGSRGATELDKFKATASKYLIKSAAKINDWNDLVTAICNGYPCTVASNQGFKMETSATGFHSPSGNWGHQMCIMGVDDTYSEKYALILNSWGDVHGHLKSLDSEKTDEDLPVGVLRVKRDTIERMIQAGETFAFSQFDGFPAQDLDKALFKLI